MTEVGPEPLTFKEKVAIVRAFCAPTLLTAEDNSGRATQSDDERRLSTLTSTSIFTDRTCTDEVEALLNHRSPGRAEEVHAVEVDNSETLSLGAYLVLTPSRSTSSVVHCPAFTVHDHITICSCYHSGNPVER